MNFVMMVVVVVVMTSLAQYVTFLGDRAPRRIPTLASAALPPFEQLASAKEHDEPPLAHPSRRIATAVEEQHVHRRHFTDH